jgi:LysM repeat protein
MYIFKITAFIRRNNMKKVYLLLTICLLFSAGSIYAQDTASGEEYIIQKGDTLWGISENKLEDNFLWPKLWDVNPHIANPDLIYPGEKIRIPSRESLMKEAAPPAEAEMPPAPEVKAPVKKPAIAPARAAAPATAEKAVTVSKKYLVDKNFYMSAGWISKDFPSIGTITTTPSGKHMAGKGDIVYINVSEKKMLARLGLETKSSLIVPLNEDSRSRYFTIRRIKEVKHPITAEKMGYLIRVTGILEIIGMDGDTPKARVLSSFEDVETGDGLMPYSDMEPPVVPDVIRRPAIDGYVVEAHYTNRLSGENNIVYLDKGSDNGLQPGDIFKIFPNAPIQRVIGEVQVISLKPATSTAVILNSSEEITPGSKWGQK